MNYYNEIKNKLIDNEVYKRVKDYSKNRNEISTYYEVGRLLIEAQGGENRAKYGDGLIKEYSERLTKDLGKKYSITSLKYMRMFYILYEKSPTLSDQLTWSHYKEILKFNDINEINYYISIIESYNLILENIESFMKELGNAFIFIGSEYKIKLGDSYHKIDLLLFNIKYNSYVVVELKVTEFKAEYISQVQKYMNYIDKNVKEVSNNSTIGILICKKKNRFVIEYCSLDSIVVREYELI